MDFDETMVDEMIDNEGNEELPEEIVEEDLDESESLESITESDGDEEESEDEQPEQPKAKAKSEPGYVKSRIDKAVAKAVAETEKRMQAMFDQQMAPIRAKMLEDEAQELVRSRKVSDIETARELVRLRNGQPATQSATPPAVQPRQQNGQFAQKQDPATSARIEMLQHQAERIEKKGGPDVRKAFMDDEDIKMKVVSGEWDFQDVADYLSEKPSRKRPPSPMRSPNGASGTNPNAIDSMSDEQFERMERKIKEGARYSLR